MPSFSRYVYTFYTGHNISAVCGTKLLKQTLKDLTSHLISPDMTMYTYIAWSSSFSSHDLTLHILPSGSQIVFTGRWKNTFALWLPDGWNPTLAPGKEDDRALGCKTTHHNHCSISVHAWGALGEGGDWKGQPSPKALFRPAAYNSEAL